MEFLRHRLPVAFALIDVFLQRPRQLKILNGVKINCNKKLIIIFTNLTPLFNAFFFSNSFNYFSKKP